MRIWLALALPLALLAQGPANNTKEAKGTKTRHAKSTKARLVKTSTTARVADPAPAVPAAEAQQPGQKAEVQPEQKKEEKPAESPAPVAEKAVSGYIDLGARWVGWAGDRNTYRSVVNLGQGVRLVGMDTAYEPTGSKWLDSARLQMFNWGGDPYNTARLDLLKRGKYRYLGTYSNVAYFNNLPSYADPTLAKGVYFDQRSYDSTIRNLDNDLQIFPGGRFIPYFGYTRNSGNGYGVTPLVEVSNEYALRNVVDWHNDEIRGGLRIEMRRWHVTIEEGGRRLDDNQQVYSTGPLTGNRTTPYLGQMLTLTSGQQQYRIRSQGEYTKGLLTANPWDWLDLSGSVVRTRPKTDANLYQTQNGTLVSPVSSTTFLTAQTDTLYGNATMPRVSWSAGAEARAAGRLRLRESFESDRFHTDGTSTLLSNYIFKNGGNGTSTLPDGERLEVSQYREQVEALYDVLKHFTVRGGFRYVWGDSVMRASSFSINGPTDRLDLKRYSGLAGFSARPFSRLSLTGDFDITNGVKTYYRTGLMDTNTYRLLGRLTLPKNFFFNANYLYFTNDNPDPGVNYHYKSQAATGSLQWIPNSGKNISIVADYTYSQIKSDINFLNPASLTPLASPYRDFANTGVLLANLRLPFSKTYSGRLSFGGSFITTHGTRPTNYFQPQGRLQLPVTQRLEFFSEWRYYGMHQELYGYEGFRAHTYTGGVRLLL